MVQDSKKNLKQIRQRVFLNKDFESFRSDLLQYAKTYYPKNIRNFAESSLGGLLLDFPAYVGDVMSFYLDHQFNELNVETAVEIDNIENHIRNAGVDITGASPSVVTVQFVVEIPAIQVGTAFSPQPNSLPLLAQGTICASNNGTRFELTEDLDYSKLDSAGELVAERQIGSTNSDGSPATFLLSLDGDCISGFTRTETFTVSNAFVAFREITLSSSDVTDIISITDSDGNIYYEVDSHSQDTVFLAAQNTQNDNEEVEKILQIQAAPHRFVAKVNLNTRATTLVFGGGSAESLDNDIVPDPSQFAIPLFGKTTFSRFSIDPKNLLNTRTLGVAPQGTTLSIQYRYGGGLLHNSAAGTIRTITKLAMKFPSQPSAALAASIRASLSIDNEDAAEGGENPPTIDELRSKVNSVRNAQSRIVTKEDLLARVYTMPSSFGRVFRASTRSNPLNPLSAQLFVISRDADGDLVPSPSSLKQNLETYLNEFRMISDAIDILDARVMNIQVLFEVAVDTLSNKNLVVQNIISKLKTFFNVENFQIDQPIRLSDVQNIIYNTQGVVSVTDLRVKSITGTTSGREYSEHSFDVASNTIKGLLVPPPGSIFNVLYPNNDILGQGV